jgi:hypothetical protein
MEVDNRAQVCIITTTSGQSFTLQLGGVIKG